jgi:hypothetical protein
MKRVVILPNTRWINPEDGTSVKPPYHFAKRDAGAHTLIWLGPWFIMIAKKAKQREVLVVPKDRMALMQKVSLLNRERHD